MSLRARREVVGRSAKRQQTRNLEHAERHAPITGSALVPGWTSLPWLVDGSLPSPYNSGEPGPQTSGEGGRW